MSTKAYFQGSTYEVREGESVLDALIRGGAGIRFSCRKGSCRTCLVRSANAPPPPGSQRGLDDHWVESNHFLPCIAFPTTDLDIQPAAAATTVEALVSEVQHVSPRVVRLLLEVGHAFPWIPGQHVTLARPDGLARSYSIASLAEDYFVELHVGLVTDGAMSTWVHEELAPGDVVRLQGPFGACTYREDDADRELALLATGTGIAPVLGVVRDALRRGHSRTIHVVHGVRAHAAGYAEAELRALAEQHPNLRYRQVVDGDPVAALFETRELGPGVVLFVFGNPDVVFEARVSAIGAGIARADIRADPFDSGFDPMPHDREKLAATPADPEMWEALGRGTILRAIIEEFYALVYRDPLLSPFFHKVTMERAIDKQYEFLFDVFSKEIVYFGLKPFNAHHWMVITDELFDYREELFEAVVRRHGVPEPLIRRWMAFHELFRREIVKPRPRGMFIGDVEVVREGFEEETLEIDMVCDGCGSEMFAGDVGRMHARTGALYCSRCSARARSVAPPPA